MNGETGEKLRRLRAVWFENNEVVMIDQRLLPGKVEFFGARNTEDIAHAIKDMVVRGAPAIGIAAAWGLALAKKNGEDMEEATRIIGGTRPTAYDLFRAIKFMIANGFSLDAARRYQQEITNRCRKIGEYGNELIPSPAQILTHCNAGALAVTEWGTALAPLRIASQQGKKIFVFVDETRPRLQGSRLTAWELQNEGIPYAVIADNAAGHFMHTGQVNLAIVGADRIAANGDFANKIGTYEKAVVAHENGVAFYVAAPVSTFDFTISSGEDIPIEERSEDEVLSLGGERLAPEKSRAKNPAFDVTPAKYVSAFITEYGIFKPSELKKLRAMIQKDLFMRED